MAGMDRELLSKIDTKLDDLNDCQIRMESDLKYHIKRTDLLEKQVKPVYTWFTAMKLIIPLLGALLLFKEQIVKLLGE